MADTHNPGPDEQVHNNDDLRHLAELLGDIDQRAAKILKLRYGLEGEDPMTLKEIGARIGLTRERVRQIEHESLAKLRDAMLAHGLTAAAYTAGRRADAVLRPARPWPPSLAAAARRRASARAAVAAAAAMLLAAGGDLTLASRVGPSRPAQFAGKRLAARAGTTGSPTRYDVAGRTVSATDTDSVGRDVLLRHPPTTTRLRVRTLGVG